MNKVAINLITWNGEKYVENCLKAVLAQTFKDFSVIIIDNGSSDKTVQIVRERFPHLKMITHRENLGFAKAHNQAIHWTKSEYVLCLNQDIVLAPDFLEHLVRFMDEKPMAGAVSGKLLRLQENELTKYIDTVGLKFFRNYRVIDIGAGEMDEGQYDAIEEVFGVSGAVPFFRRKALDEVIYQNEYFDESFFSYKEDVDLAHRLRLAGWTAWRMPLAIAYHDRSVSGLPEKYSSLKVAENWHRKSKFAKFYSYRNHLYFVYKNLPRFNFYFSWPVFWYELVKFFYILIFETRNLRAWKDFFRVRGELSKKRKLALHNRKVDDEAMARWLN